MMLTQWLFCVRFQVAQNVAGGGPVTMSYRPRVHSLGRYDDRSNGADRSFGEQRGGPGVSSAGDGGADSWTSDHDVTDSAWQRTIRSSSSSLSSNRGQFTPLSGLRFVHTGCVELRCGAASCDMRQKRRSTPHRDAPQPV